MKHVIPITLVILLLALPISMFAAEIGILPGSVVDIPVFLSGYVMVSLAALLVEDVRTSSRSTPKKRTPVGQKERSKQATPAAGAAWVHQTASA